MKKTFIFIAAAMFILTPLAAQTITVTSPTGGDEWCHGCAYTITWTSSGVSGPVDVILRPWEPPTAPPTLGIAAGTANDGAEGWAIPSSVTVGYYYVRIRSLNNPAVFADSKNFKIIGYSAPAIAVTKPDGTDWCWGDHVQIQWTSSCVPGPVDIILRPADAPAAPPILGIAAGTANDRSEGWNITTSIAAGRYIVRIRSVNAPAVIGDSAAFKIGECAATAKVQVTRPASADKVWYENVGALQPINWVHWNWDGNVKLLLMKNGKYKGVIARHLPVSLHSWKWPVGKLESGKLVDPGTGYRIRLVREYPGPMIPILQLSDESSEFEIKIGTN